MNDREIFLDAIEIDHLETRAAFVTNACRGDPMLLAQVQELLKFHDESESLFDASSPASMVDESTDVGGLTTHHSPTDASAEAKPPIPADPDSTKLYFSRADDGDPTVMLSVKGGPGRSRSEVGAVIANRYRLVEVIGEGGMGTVFRADQTEPVKRQVALKLIKGGMDSKTVLARFDAERQALAMMDHPNIAQVYDGGTTEQGAPYFVMEFVQGVPITEYCDGHRLTVKARLELFIFVCRAIQHAHQKGIIHRDLKPGNVLVTELDGRATPKVIDFGVAKATEIDLTDKTIDDLGAIIGTPSYMSPEQAAPMSMDIDTRTDVYSLGVLLYELLTGSPPIGKKKFPRAEILEVLRMVREVEPPRPSTRVSTAADLPDIATKRGIEATRLVRLLQGDLDWILLKAIEKDRTRRYETASGLAADLVRHLEHEPVVARPPSTLYRIQKAWQRNQLAFTAAAIVIATMIAGISISTIAALDAIAARESESEQKQKAIRARDSAAEQKQAAITAEHRAEKEARDNLRLAREAELARQASQTTVADMQTQRGLLAANDGDSAAAMLWFANAATQTPHDSQRAVTNRLRAWNAKSDSFLPAACMRLPNGQALKKLRFQPRGELLLTCRSNHAQIWNWELEQSLPWLDQISDPGDVCWSPNGRQIAIGLSSGDVQIRAVPSGERIKQFTVAEPVTAVEFSPDGTRLVTAGQTVRIWNLERSPVQLEREWLHPSAVHSLSFNRRGDRLATACRDHHVRLFSLTADQNAPLFPPVKHELRNEIPPVFVNDDRQLVTIADNRRPVWWDTVTGADVTPSAAMMQAGTVFCLTSSLDGNLVAVTADREAMIFDRDGKKTVFPHPHFVSWVAFSPDSRQLATGCDDFTVLVWDRERNDRPMAKVPHMEALAQVAFSGSGNLLVAMGWNRIRMWTCPELDPVVGYFDWPISSWRPRVSFDGRWVTLSPWHEGPIGNLALTSVTVKDTQTGRPVGPAIAINGITDSCICCDNRSLAVTSYESDAGRLSIFDVASGRQIMPPVPLSAAPVSVAARNADRDVAVLCQDGQVAVLNSQDGSRRYQCSVGASREHDRFARLAYSPDGRTLVVLTSESQIHVFTAETGQLRYPPIRPLLEGSMICRVITFSPDSRWLATGVTGRNAVQVWDLQTGRPASDPLPHPGDFYGIFALNFSPDGRWILSGNKDGRARVWDWQTATLVCPALEHQDEVLDVAFLPDGCHAVTAVRRGSVQLWELVTGKQIASPIRIPRVPHPWTNTLTMIGDRVIAGSMFYPLIDLSALMREPSMSNESLIRVAELSTARRLQLGELNGISETEWLSAWNTFKSQEFSPRQQAEELVAKLDRTTDELTRSMILQNATRSEPVLEQLLELKPDSPELHVVLARLRSQQSDPRAAGHRARAIELYQRQVDHLDENALGQFAELLFDSAKSNWQPLQIRDLHSRDGATMEQRTDGAIVVSGIHGLGDVYTMSAVAGAGEVKAIRLEVLPDSSLPRHGPGRHESGNFQLAAFRLYRTAEFNGKERTAVTISDAWASYTYPAPRIDILGTIDEDRHQVWHVFGRPGQPHYAYYIPSEAVKVDEQHPLVIELTHHGVEPAINLGCFRLSSTNDLRDFQLEQDLSLFRRPPFSGSYQLASAYLATGKLDQALQLLQRANAPLVPAEKGLRLFLQAEIYERLKQPSSARPFYEQLRDWLKANLFNQPLQRHVTERLRKIDE